MTKEQIIENFQKAIQGRLDNAISYQNNLYFDKLLEFCNTDYGYLLFFPIAKGYFNCGIQFDHFCELFDRIDYACTDCGMMLCHVVTEYAFTKDPVFIKRFNVDPILQYKNTFILNRDYNDYNKEVVLETAITHFNYEKHTLKEIHSTPMNYALIDFLYSIIPDIKNFKELSKLDDNGEASMKAEKLLEQKIVDYIKNAKFYYVQRF